MKKKEYEKPTTMVVKLDQQYHLLTLSNPGDYPDGGDPLASPSNSRFFEDEELLF